MKKLLLIGVMALVCVGCANHIVPVGTGAPVGGTGAPMAIPALGGAIIYSKHRGPLSYDFDNTPVASKSGKSSNTYVYDFLITGFDWAWGYSDIRQAVRNGGLTEVYYVDYEVTRLFGIFVKVDVIAYGA